MKKLSIVIITIILIWAIAFFTPIILREMHHHRGQRRIAAKTQLKEFGNVLKLYKMKKGAYPDTLETITVPNKSGDTFIDEIPLDPWNNKYFYTKINGKFEIVCFGADGIPGGKRENSDIKYSELYKKDEE